MARSCGGGLVKKLGMVVIALLGLALLPAPAGAAATSCIANAATGVVRCGAPDPSARSIGYVLVARLYDGTGYTGRVLRIYRTRPCTLSLATTELQLDLAQVSYYGRWNNRVMSFKTYNGCDLKAYDGPDGREFYGWSRWTDRDADMVFSGHNWRRRVDVIRLS